MVYKCSVCGKDVKDDLLVYINHTEEHIVDEIRAHHPELAGEDGLCEKCIEYYRSQIKGEPPKEE